MSSVSCFLVLCQLTPDTLCTPRLPVPEQYAAEAQALDLNVTPAAVKAAFKPGSYSWDFCVPAS